MKGLRTFQLQNYNCKVLFLEIDDAEGELDKIHDGFKKFPYFEKYQQAQYIPHITIAYVNSDFELNNSTYSGPIFLQVSEIRHKIKRI